ncbi:MAG: carbohydrate kinase family protein [Candidatus Heimdallarchaeota archaeon]
MKILGFGQVLWDLTVNTDCSFLEKFGFKVGGHHLVDKQTLDDIVTTLQSQGKEITKNSGGSVANVMSNMAKLGTKTAFCGKHGDDANGRKYMEILANEGVEPFGIIDKENSTGQLISVITPDMDRSFIVYWGASETLQADVIDEKFIKSAEICHIEGYLIINSEEALKKIFEHANKLTYDLAAYSVVEKTRPTLQKLMKIQQPFILFSNIFEGKSFTQKETPEEIIDVMLNFTDIAVLTLGEDGVHVKTNTGEHHFEQAIKTNLVDTTGAGDSFSAGFLHEYLKSNDIKKAAKLGVHTASATISKLGARSLDLTQIESFKL